MNPELVGATCAEPTSDPEWWTGHAADGHAKAAIVCLGCPVRRACAVLAEAERLSTNPPRWHQTALRPLGVRAGRLYDGTYHVPTLVRIAEKCSECSRTFVPDRSNVRRCERCRASHGRARAGAA